MLRRLGGWISASGWAHFLSRRLRRCAVAGNLDITTLLLLWKQEHAPASVRNQSLAAPTVPFQYGLTSYELSAEGLLRHSLNSCGLAPVLRATTLLQTPVFRRTFALAICFWHCVRRHSPHYPSFMCCYAALATLCSAALATQPSPFDVLLCGTRNTVFGGTRHTTPTLLIHVLLSGTRGTVLGGTRHTIYSCVVKRYSRHCVRRHSPLF